LTQALVVGLIAILMTIGVYGDVAFIVKLDVMGLYLLTEKSVRNVATIKKYCERLILSFFGSWY
jgi:predicted DNA repair protein MutK